MRTFLFVLLRTGFVIIPFISGLLLGAIRWREENNSTRFIVKAAIITGLYIASGVIERLFETYFNMERIGILQVSTAAFFVGWSVFLWWPRLKKQMGESLTRFIKILLFILSLIWIPDRLTFEIEVLSPVIFFSLLSWVIWELKLKIYPPKKLLGDEI
jgi:hypothetical protein